MKARHDNVQRGRTGLFMFVSAVIFGLMLMACGDQGESDTDIGVLVQSSKEQLSIPGAPNAPSGKKYLVLGVMVTNNSAVESISIAYPLFSAEVDSGIEVMGSQVSLMLQNYCAVDQKVSPGKSYTCQVAFELAWSAVPLNLWFRPSADQNVSAPIPASTCKWCGNVCVDLSSSSDHCGACNNRAGKNAVCAKGKITCTNAVHSLCGNDCVDLKTDSDHCGKCNNKIALDQMCKNGVPVAKPPSPFGAKCTSTCVQGFVCKEISAISSYCTKKCTNKGQACTSTPAGTAAFCILPDSTTADLYCGFLCKTKTQTWNCPSQLKCSAKDNPLNSGQHFCE